MANQQGEDNDTWSSLWREAMMAMSLGWDLAVPIFGGVLLGYTLDRWLQTRYIFTVGLLFMGIAISYYNLARFIQRIDREDGQDEKEGEQGS